MFDLIRRMFGLGANTKEAQINRPPEQGEASPVHTVTVQGDPPNYLHMLKMRRLKAKRARQARKNSRRGMSNPKHLQMVPVRLVA